MRPGESFVGQPIRSLQTMLRVLAENDKRYISLIPDGIYGPETVRAVTNFQRQHGIPVTGVADQVTWDAVVAAFEPALVEQDTAEPVAVILDPGQVIRKGEDNFIIPLVQGMLTVLALVYGSVGQPGTGGILDSATADSLSSFQSLSRLPMTGDLDRMTWKHLALQYPLAANLRKLRK